MIPPVSLKGDLFIPSKSRAIIIFVHGSGSNRFSIRNEFISKYFNEHDMGNDAKSIIVQYDDISI